MIKAEVVFDGERMNIGNYQLVADSYVEIDCYRNAYSKNIWRVRPNNYDYLLGERLFTSLQEAIQFCLEN